MLGRHGAGHIGAMMGNPYGNTPHTPAVNPYAGPGAGQGGGGIGAYSYPYYTTRGPRDFLQNGCGPVPIVGGTPRKTCLPSIGF